MDSPSTAIVVSVDKGIKQTRNEETMRKAKRELIILWNTRTRNDSQEGKCRQKAVVMGDVNMHALQFIVDWLQSNAQQFKANCYGQSFGFIDGERWYIYPSVLDEALKKNEYSSRKTRRFLADKNVIEKDMEDRFTVMKRNSGTGQLKRMISLSLPTAMAILEGEPDDGYPF